MGGGRMGYQIPSPPPLAPRPLCKPRSGLRKENIQPIGWEIQTAFRRRRVLPAHPTSVGENQKVAQNVASSTKVSSRNSSEAAGGGGGDGGAGGGRPARPGG